jgi:hypothetical protein
METLGNFTWWAAVCFLLALGAMALYMGRYFSAVICDIAAASYLLVLGLGICGIGLVEVYNLCVANGHGTHETLDSKKKKGSKAVSIGRVFFGGGVVLCLAIANVSVYFSNTCERTSGESAAIKLDLKYFNTLYDALRTVVSILDFACLILVLTFVWTKCDATGGDESGTHEENERLTKPETNRSAMEKHHMET